MKRIFAVLVVTLACIACATNSKVSQSTDNIDDSKPLPIVEPRRSAETATLDEITADGPLGKVFDREGFRMLEGSEAALSALEKVLVHQLDSDGYVPESDKVIVITMHGTVSYPDLATLKDGERAEYARDTVYRAVGYVGDEIRVFERTYSRWQLPIPGLR